MKKFLYVITIVLFYSFSNVTVLHAKGNTSRENIQKLDNESWIVTFDPDDGTPHGEAPQISVTDNGIIANQPQTPIRDGFIFKAWAYAFDDNDNPLFWDFANQTVTDNTTLWAVWEEGYIVTFDPIDGVSQYPDFYKTTVEIDGKITNKPDNPQRDGYIFKGWAYVYDDDDNPVLWDFANQIVTDNTTLWAAWEEGCIVTFDPADGTEYRDFLTITVATGEKITNKPDNPQRDGFIFKGWYHALDEKNNPIYWDFENMPVTVNTMLWASWEIDNSIINPNGESVEAPATGDSTKNFMVFVGLIIGSGLVIGWYYRKKRRSK